MARRQGHLLDLGNVPRRNEQAPRLGLRRIVSHDLRDLVDRTAVGTGPRTPLVAVDVVQIAVAVSLKRRLPPARARNVSRSTGA